MYGLEDYRKNFSFSSEQGRKALECFKQRSNMLSFMLFKRSLAVEIMLIGGKGRKRKTD